MSLPKCDCHEKYPTWPVFRENYHVDGCPYGEIDQLQSRIAELEKEREELWLAIWHTPGDPQPTFMEDIDADHETTRRMAVDQAHAFEQLNPLLARVAELEAALAAERERCAEIADRWNFAAGREIRSEWVIPEEHGGEG